MSRRATATEQGDNNVQELVQSGGWMMLPILICSVVALAIVAERFWTLRPSRLAPAGTLAEVQGWLKKGQLSDERLETLRSQSALGVILAAGLANARHGMIHGTGDAAQLAGGISQALLTTAGGLVVAIPAIFFHRFFVRRVEEITVGLEQNAVHLVDLVHGDREPEQGQGAKS